MSLTRILQPRLRKINLDWANEQDSVEAILSLIGEIYDVGPFPNGASLAVLAGRWRNISQTSTVGEFPTSQVIGSYQHAGVDIIHASRLKCVKMILDLIIRIGLENATQLALRIRAGDEVLKSLISYYRSYVHSYELDEDRVHSEVRAALIFYVHFAETVSIEPEVFFNFSDSEQYRYHHSIGHSTRVLNIYERVGLSDHALMSFGGSAAITMKFMYGVNCASLLPDREPCSMRELMALGLAKSLAVKDTLLSNAGLELFSLSDNSYSLIGGNILFVPRGAQAQQIRRTLLLAYSGPLDTPKFYV